MASKDIEAVFLYTQSQNISIDKQEFEFQIETHPDYPSLLAFSDTLNFFDIPNIAFNFTFLLSNQKITWIPKLNFA